MDDPGLRQLADNALTGLAIHIAIAIDRVQQGAVVNAGEKVLEDLTSWDGYDLASRILRKMEGRNLRSRSPAWRSPIFSCTCAAPRSPIPGPRAIRRRVTTPSCGGCAESTRRSSWT